MTLKQDIAELAQVVASLAKRIDEKEQKEQERRSPGTVEKPALPGDIALESALDGPSDPVPSEYRAVVDQKLNKEFGIHVQHRGPSFKFTVLVPQKYSSLNENQRKMLGFDMRTKMIDNAEGVNGVGLWCDRVYSSFNPVVQGQITNDRILNP